MIIWLQESHKPIKNTGGTAFSLLVRYCASESFFKLFFQFKIPKFSKNLQNHQPSNRNKFYVYAQKIKQTNYNIYKIFTLCRILLECIKTSIK